jgi:hypothetical protein
MLCHFSGPTHIDADTLRDVNCIDLIMQDSAACYQATREALLFRLPF